MPYFVLALGLTMSVVGVLAVLTGYPIIQIERGWATVIAGATLLAGGVVTLALGLVLRAVSALQAALVQTRAESPQGEISQVQRPTSAQGGMARGDEPNFAEFDRPAPEAVTVVPAASAAATELHDDHATEESTFSSTAVVQRETGDFVADEYRPFEEPRFADDAREATLYDDEQTLPAPAVPGMPPKEPERAVPLAAALHQGQGSDWLDRSLAEFDRENADVMTHAPTEPDLPQPLPDPVSDDPVPEPPTEPPHADSAVVGRYEADGTAYVMFADGSIEASSPAGVYRFASMAELKAFIEG